MSEHYMPFGSSSGDRKVTSADFARYFGAFIGDGVLVNPSTNLQVLANSAMTVTLKLGMGFINHGYFYYNDGDLTLTIDTADGVMNRKDNIVIRWDIDTRSVSAQVVKGTPASSATAPALVRTNEQYDLKVAEISIPAGTTAITQGLITDTRANSSVCGYSTGVLQQIDATTLFAQFTASFNTWFEEMKGQLSTDAAGHLQTQIDQKAVSLLTCQTSSTVHALTGLVATSGIVYCIFKADANYVAGNTFTVGGTAYTVVTSGGEALRSGAFLANDIVSVKLDITNTKLYIRQESAEQVGAAYCWVGAMSDAQINDITTLTDTRGFATILNTVMPYSGYWNIWRSRWDFSTNHPHERAIDVNTGAEYTRQCTGTAWTAWQNTKYADYASGLNPETAPCLVNTLVLPYRTSTIPTGLADNTFVWRKDVAAP